jgi:cytochrome c556
MQFTKILAVAAIAAIGATAATADVAQKRDQLMRMNGGAMGALGAMAKGETEFDARVAALGFQALNTVAAVFGDYYPEGSQSTEGKFYGSPKIWEDRAGFDAAVAEFAKVTAAAMEAKPADKEAFLAVLGPIGKTCGTCHETYRVKAE